MEHELLSVLTVGRKPAVEVACVVSVKLLLYYQGGRGGDGGWLWQFHEHAMWSDVLRAA